MAAFDFFRRILHNVPAREPAHEPGNTATTGRRSVARKNAREGLRVLIIDDSATVVATLGRMLRQNHYDTAGAGDAETGIVFAREQVPDLIFLDIVLPGMSGFDALRTLRREEATRDIPIIMISGNAQATEQFYVRRIGADDFMKKPFGRAEVFARIQALVEAGRLPARESLAQDLPEGDDVIVQPDDATAEAAPGATS